MSPTPPSDAAAPTRENEFTAERHVYEPHRVGLPPLCPTCASCGAGASSPSSCRARNLRAQHFDTAFGQLWLVLNPLLLAVVYFLLVDILRRGTSADRASSRT